MISEAEVKTKVENENQSAWNVWPIFTSKVCVLLSNHQILSSTAAISSNKSWSFFDYVSPLEFSSAETFMVHIFIYLNLEHTEQTSAVSATHLNRLISGTIIFFK